MNTEYPLPIRYVLYSHYPEGEDLNDYLHKNKQPRELNGVRFLVSHLEGLSNLLTWPGHEGLLVLFYAPGFAKCLEGIAEGKDETTLVRTCKELEFARAVDTYLQTEYRGLVSHLRFVTALDLHKVFGRMKNWKTTQHLRSWFVGRGEGIRYDSPKIVEAIVRLRLLGSGIPVFRVDYDVLFRGEENRDKKNLEFSSTIGSCLNAYGLRRDSPNLSSFIFSASYDYKALLKCGAENNFRVWSRAFATRVLPALPIRKGLIRKVMAQKGEWSKYTWDDYATQAFRGCLARKFFGFSPSKETLNTPEICGIGKVGAHPISSIISGAMLYMSDGAILDLPPFSNFRLNVSWIDDHLKYCLHRELRHLSPAILKASANKTRYDPLLRRARLDDVIVQKAGRKVPEDLPKYLFDQYFPTLLWGIIMDSWITPNPLLKYRPEDLAKNRLRALSRISAENQSGAVLASALHKALEEGDFGPAEEETLEKKLFNVALNRINEVRRQWIELTVDGLETFASIWAKGQARSYFPSFKLKYSGIANPRVVPIDKDIGNIVYINRFLYSDLFSLVKDAMEYIEWTLQWPKIVQVVRSIEQGTLRTDLNFDPERERAEMSSK